MLGQLVPEREPGKAQKRGETVGGEKWEGGKPVLAWVVLLSVEKSAFKH